MAVGLTFTVGVGSIGCLSILFVLFWWTILQEDPEDPEVIRRKLELVRLNKLDLSNMGSSGGAGGSKIGMVNPMQAGGKVSLGDGSTAGRSSGDKRRRRSTRDLSEVLGGGGEQGEVGGKNKANGRKKGWAQLRALVGTKGALGLRQSGDNDDDMDDGDGKEGQLSQVGGKVLGSKRMRRKTMRRMSGAIGVGQLVSELDRMGAAAGG